MIRATTLLALLLLAVGPAMAGWCSDDPVDPADVRVVYVRDATPAGDVDVRRPFKALSSPWTTNRLPKLRRKAARNGCDVVLVSRLPSTRHAVSTRDFANSPVPSPVVHTTYYDVPRAALAYGVGRTDK